MIFTNCRTAATDTSTNQNSNVADTASPTFSVPESNINLANPLVVSPRPDDVALCEKINRKIDESPFANARWGIFAVSLRDGRVVCSRDGRKLFNPASIEKTLTAIVALDKLGADFRWKTSVYAANTIDADGSLNGDLTLYGGGAPDFDSAALENLVNQLQTKGLRRVKGDIIGDQSYFRGDTIGDGWTWNELQWWYGREASALTFNDNQAFVNVENGGGRASTDYLNVTVGKPTPITNSNNAANYETGGIKRGLEDNNFYIWGSSKNFGAKVAVAKPAGWRRRVLEKCLRKRELRLKVRRRHATGNLKIRLIPQNQTNSAAVESATLGEIVRKMNKIRSISTPN